VKAGHGLFSSTSRTEGGILRDRAMADNVFWILKQQAPEERVIIWAHNAHIARTPFSMPGLTDEPVADLACHLAKRLGAKLVTIAATFGAGRYTGTAPPGAVTFETSDPSYLDGALARVGPPVFVLDLRRAPAEGPVHDWLHTQRRLRSQDMDMLLTPAEAYDVVYYVAEASRATPNPAALERFRAMSRAPSVTEQRD
jgi:erythromycin esterase